MDTLTTKFTRPKLLETIMDEISGKDLRTNILVSHLWAERFMECMIIQKFKNHNEINRFDFTKKRKILFGLGIINDTRNQDLKILNDIRVEYAHEIHPKHEKSIKLIKKFKSHPDKKTIQEHHLVDEMTILGWITILLLGYLMDVFWEIHPKDEKS